MKSRKQVWIAALCLLLATVITLGFRARLASDRPASTPAHASRAMSTQPVAHLANASLRAAEVRNAMMLDDDAGLTRVGARQQSNRPVLPQVEEFTLTPPNPAQQIFQSFLSVRFPELAAEKLAPRRIPSRLAARMLRSAALCRRPEPIFHAAQFQLADLRSGAGATQTSCRSRKNGSRISRTSPPAYRENAIRRSGTDRRGPAIAPTHSIPG